MDAMDEDIEEAVYLVTMEDFDTCEDDMVIMDHNDHMEDDLADAVSEDKREPVEVDLEEDMEATQSEQTNGNNQQLNGDHSEEGVDSESNVVDAQVTKDKEDANESSSTQRYLFLIPVMSEEVQQGHDHTYSRSRKPEVAIPSEKRETKFAEKRNVEEEIRTRIDPPHQGLRKFRITDDIISREELEEEKWSLVKLVLDTMTIEQTIQFVARRGLIKNTRNCRICGKSCHLARGKGADEIKWRCWKCNTNLSIRKGSCFEQSRLHISAVLRFIYAWCHEWPLEAASRESGIQSTATAVEWAKFCREVCSAWVQQHGKIGGTSKEGDEAKIVEIGESFFQRAENHRKNEGPVLKGFWVFGGIERDSGKCFLAKVENKDKETLQALIQKHVLPGTHIVSDGKGAFLDMGQFDYRHSVVHGDAFVDSVNKCVHTQNLKNMFMRFKRKLRFQFGTLATHFDSYLDEFVWRNSVRKKDFVFTRFLLCLSQHQEGD